MRKSEFSLVGVTAVVFLLACGGTPPSGANGQQSLAPSLQTAGSGGAVVYRSDDEAFNLGFLWNDAALPGQERLIAVLSGDPAFGLAAFCDGLDPIPGEGWLWLTYHEVSNPAQRFIFSLRGEEYTRVYRATIPEAPTNAWMCSLLRGEVGPLLAEGVSSFHWNFVTNQTLRGSGLLDATSCSSGTARFDFSVHYQLAKDAAIGPDCTLLDPDHDIRRIQANGPDLTCLGR
jgi:hypothetical protein